MNIILIAINTSLIVVAFVLRGKLLRTLHLENEKTYSTLSQSEISFPESKSKNGDELEIRVGEMVPHDGVILKGVTGLDLKNFSPDLQPHLRGPGDRVYAGTINTDANILMRVEEDNEGCLRKRLDREWINFIDWQKKISHNFEKARKFLTSFLVIPLALSVPIAFFFTDIFHLILSFAAVALSFIPSFPALLSAKHSTSIAKILREQSVWVSRPEQIESLGNLNLIYFDKSGTLTQGKFTPSQTLVEFGSSLGEALSILFSLEKGLDHPLAEAVKHHEWYPEIKFVKISNRQIHPGLGITAEIFQLNGRTYAAAVGNVRLMKRHGFFISREMRSRIDELEAIGETVVLCGFKGETRCLVSFTDRLRPGVRETLTKIHELGVEMGIMTGDSEQSILHLTQSLGIKRCHSHCLPHEKAARLARERDQGLHIGFVSEGKNTEEAMNHAEVSFAIGVGLQPEKYPAGLKLPGDRINRLPDILEMARREKKLEAQMISQLKKLQIATLLIGAFCPWLPAIGPLLSLSFSYFILRPKNECCNDWNKSSSERVHLQV